MLLQREIYIWILTKALNSSTSFQFSRYTKKYTLINRINHAKVGSHLIPPDIPFQAEGMFRDLPDLRKLHTVTYPFSFVEAGERCQDNRFFIARHCQLVYDQHHQLLHNPRMSGISRRKHMRIGIDKREIKRGRK